MKILNRTYIISFLLILGLIFLNEKLPSQEIKYPSHVVTGIKAERIRLTNDSIRITWTMDRSYKGEFIVGRSEEPLKSTSDTLKSKLIGIFKSEMDGVLIDRDIQPGKKYYYIVLAKEQILKRNIDIVKNENYTTEPVTLFIEPETIKSLKAEVSDHGRILLKWNSTGNFRYNIYRSRSPISSKGELEVSVKIGSAEKNTYTDTTIPDFGTYFYAVTLTDKNDIEYFTPKPDDNYTSKGIYIKGKSKASPLNIGAFKGENDNIIIKWEKAESRTDKKLTGYELYRSDEIINSLLKLKFSRLIYVADMDSTGFTDRNLPPGKYCYAIFPKYEDGTSDINFDNNLNFTTTPILITRPYTIVSTSYDVIPDNFVLRWTHSGNTGDENVRIFKTPVPPSLSSGLKESDFIGTANIRSGKYTLKPSGNEKFYYGVLSSGNIETVKIEKGVNLTNIPIGAETGPDHNKKTDDLDKNILPDTAAENRDLEQIIKNTYYKRRYSAALKELKSFIKRTDNNYDRSKARLFLAKTYIETEDYRNSLKLLGSEDVRKNFPDESKFWFEFAIVRLK